MSFVNVRGVRLHVQRIGRGQRTVVFLHGLVMDNLSSWYYTVANPVARVCDAVLYDLRGHGLSERPCTGYSVRDGVADLAALLDALSIHHPVYLAGNSYGGLVSLCFARRHPERVAGLLLVEAHYPVDGWGDQVTGTLREACIWNQDPRTVAFFETNQDRRHHNRRRNSFDLIEQTSIVEDLRNETPFREIDIRGVSAPALALYGERSDIIDRGYQLARCMPNCELRVLPDSTHSILMERTHQVRDHMIGWLEKQPPRAELA